MKKIQKLKTPHWQMILKKWNGESGCFQYSQERISYWKMMIEKDGTIYYMTQETPRKIRIWSPASKLHSHLLRLYRQGSGDIKKIV